jgi:hypothetical protein
VLPRLGAGSAELAGHSAELKRKKPDRPTPSGSGHAPLAPPAGRAAVGCPAAHAPPAPGAAAGPAIALLPPAAAAAAAAGQPSRLAAAAAAPSGDRAPPHARAAPAPVPLRPPPAATAATARQGVPQAARIQPSQALLPASQAPPPRGLPAAGLPASSGKQPSAVRGPPPPSLLPRVAAPPCQPTPPGLSQSSGATACKAQQPPAATRGSAGPPSLVPQHTKAGPPEPRVAMATAGAAVPATAAAALAPGAARRPADIEVPPTREELAQIMGVGSAAGSGPQKQLPARTAGSSTASARTAASAPVEPPTLEELALIMSGGMTPVGQRQAATGAGSTPPAGGKRKADVGAPGPSPHPSAGPKRAKAHSSMEKGQTSILDFVHRPPAAGATPHAGPGQAAPAPVLQMSQGQSGGGQPSLSSGGAHTSSAREGSAPEGRPAEPGKPSFLDRLEQQGN